MKPVKTLKGLNENLKTFEGDDLNEITQGGQIVGKLSVKKALISYIVNSHVAGVDRIDQAIAYDIGKLIGESKYNDLPLTQPHYDLLKKLVDNNKIEGRALFNCLINEQLKRLIDSAEKYEEEKKELPDTADEEE